MTDKRIRVLFVDDEEGNLKAFKSTFRRDMDVLLATSGPEALELLERQEVHVIISDQRMPGMTGSEFLAIARERHPRAMRMLLTGYADLEAVVQAVNQGGIYAYATKPWDENDLKLRIEQAFEVQQLREEKDKLFQQYRQVFDAAGDPIALVDHRGRIIEANAACAKLLGTPLQELPGKGFVSFLEDAKGLVGSLKKNRRGTDFINVDLTIRKADGRIIDCLMTATYLGRQGSDRDVFQAIIKDVTDRKQEEHRLRKLNADLDRRVAVRTAQLLEALEDLGSFSYSVAHDLRSPLKNIVALSDHLHGHAEAQSDTDACAFTERIRKAAQRLIDLVDDLLRFSQTNTREMERTTVDLRSLVGTVIEEQVPEQRRDQVVLEIAPDVQLLADAPMIKVVLHNLLSNALKFTRHEAEPHIVIDHHMDGGRDIITIRDNGVGFDARQKDMVFGVFKRMHKADQFEGTGVGLAIVQRIVSKHGGEAWVESTVGEGTSISIALPRHMDMEFTTPRFKVA
jgi:PAS domain S-box-containing protein